MEYYAAVKNKKEWAGAGWFSWLECHPVHRKVMGSIPGQGTYLGCGFHPQLE